MNENPSAIAQPMVRFDKVSKRYGPLTVLDALELDIAANEKFNGIALFGTAATDLGGVNTAMGSISVATNADAGTAATAVETAIKSVATLRATNGAAQSNYSFQAELLTVNKANLEAANSRIVDVDVADESTQLARYNILVQSGTAMLAQANQSAQVALKLLQ